MTHIVIVQPGQSEVVASGPQYGVRYVLTAPDGTRAVFNDPTDADYVGMLSNITGLDSPEVREAADDLIGDDGGVHGTFLYGRRPIVIEGQIDNRPGPHNWREINGEQVWLNANEVRNVRMTKLQRVTNAMRGDTIMRWRPEGGTDQYVRIRRQQPLRISGAFNKTFQAAMVAADPRIYAALVKEQRFTPNDHDVFVSNDGSSSTPPTATIFGPSSSSMTDIEVHNHTTGQFIVFAPAFGLTPGDSVVVDFANRTVMSGAGTNLFSQIQFADSEWFQLAPGQNHIALHASGTTTDASMVLRWQDAWI